MPKKLSLTETDLDKLTFGYQWCLDFTNQKPTERNQRLFMQAIFDSVSLGVLSDTFYALIVKNK